MRSFADSSCGGTDGGGGGGGGGGGSSSVSSEILALILMALKTKTSLPYAQRSKASLQHQL